MGLFATVELRRKHAQSRVCTPGFNETDMSRSTNIHSSWVIHCAGREQFIQAIWRRWLVELLAKLSPRNAHTMNASNAKRRITNGDANVLRATIWISKEVALRMIVVVFGRLR